MRLRLYEFTGRDFSMGFRTGRLYKVRYIRYARIFRWLNHGCKYSAWIKDGNKYVYCPYESKESFLENWKQI